MSRALRFYVPVYAATLLLSAFLLFAIQPLFSKMILPMLGGSPSVWNTAMVFFQAMLLAGYAYAHISSHFLKPTAQAALHIILLLAFAVVLPIAIPAAWQEPPATSNPAFWQLGLMTVAVGGPFFVLAGTAPMLQRWFSFTGHAHADNPYFLYAASNFGSMSALLLYPLLFEPLLIVKQQSWSWTFGYGALIALTALCALLIFGKGGTSAAHEHKQARARPANDNDLSVRHIVLWLILSFVPSSLMLGVTTYITTDLASVPLLWVIPLALYVGTFIIAFARVAPVKLNTVILWQGVFMALVAAVFASNLIVYKIAAITLHLLLLFLTALMCHMQMAATRPATRHLTAFYLIMSLGGVLGGMFNALLAPQIFIMPIEYALVLALAAFLRYQTDPAKSFKSLLAGKKALTGAVILCALALLAGTAIYFLDSVQWKLALAMAIFIYLLFLIGRRWAFAIAAAFILLLHPGYNWNMVHKTLAWERNFFGVLRVADEAQDVRLFSHGTTLHGAQPLLPDLRLTPISYYYKDGPAWDIFKDLDHHKTGPQNVAVLGLGIGSVACYSAPQRHFDFYEIDPDVATIAENKNLFTYLSDCSSPYDIIIGDGRLKIAQVPDESYDLILLDAFSSDNIPVHLMTREAFDIYLKKLKPGGIIGVNISNRYLKLEPVVAAIGRDLGLHSKFRSRKGGKIDDTNLVYAGSIFGVLGKSENDLRAFTAAKGWHGWDLKADQKAWRDDYSNLIGAMRWKKPVAPKEQQKTP